MSAESKLIAHLIACQKHQRGDGIHPWLTNANVDMLIRSLSRTHNQTSQAPWAWPEAGELFND